MITKEDVLKLAALSKLCVSDEEADSLTAQLENIIEFAREIQNAGFETDTPLEITHTETLFRKDEIKASIPLEEALSNAPMSEDGFFLVRKRSEHG